jgi:hypothetical protein
LASRSLWDPHTDTCVAHTYQSQEMFCTSSKVEVDKGPNPIYENGPKKITQGMHPKWHPIPYIELWSKVVHYGP